jgi:hypothetical protein
VFSLASKIAPCVVFVDEVDAILGRRDKNGEHEAMRKIKNEAPHLSSDAFFDLIFEGSLKGLLLF